MSSNVAKITYETSAYKVTSLIRSLFVQVDKEVSRGEFPNSWGGYNAFKKATVRKTLEHLGLPYTKELGSFVREVLWPEHPEFNYDSHVERALIGLSLQEALFMSPKEKETWRRYGKY